MSVLNLERAKEILLEIFEVTKPDEGHGLEHALKVHSHVVEALKSSKEKLTHDIIMMVELASLLHDVEDHKFVPKKDRGKWIEYFFLEYFGDKYDMDEFELVMEIIDSVSCSKHGDTRIRKEKWFYITRYADRLEASGKTGVERAIIYSQYTNRPMFTEDTIRIYDKDELRQKIDKSRYEEYIQNGGKTSGVQTTIDHLYDKVIHIDIPDWMDNDYLKNEIKIRRAYVEGWIVGFWTSQG